MKFFPIIVIFHRSLYEEEKLGIGDRELIPCGEISTSLPVF